MCVCVCVCVVCVCVCVRVCGFLQQCKSYSIDEVSERSSGNIPSYNHHTCARETMVIQHSCVLTSLTPSPGRGGGGTASPPGLGGRGAWQPHPQPWEGGGHGSLTPSPGRGGGETASPPALGEMAERQPHLSCCS